MSKTALERFKSVSSVEVELWPECNLKCPFCFNIERKGERISFDIYTKLIDELAEADFNKLISFARYSEPLLDDTIFAAIELAREKLPEVELHIETNGVFLDRKCYDRLVKSGLSSICINIYSYPFEMKDAIELADDMSERLGYEYDVVVNVPGLSYMIVLKNVPIPVRIRARNFDMLGSDRGGVVDIGQRLPRTKPCSIPRTNIYIDYNGCVLPCCNLSSDIPEHRKFIIGNIRNKKPIWEIYNKLWGQKLSEWLDVLEADVPKEFPCATCTLGIIH